MKIKNLIEFIEKETCATYIEDGDTVDDACFALNPYMTESLYGDGKVALSFTAYKLDMLYADKMELIVKADSVWKALKQNRYGCSAPIFSFEKNGKMWKASMDVTGGSNGKEQESI